MLLQNWILVLLFFTLILAQNGPATKCKFHQIEIPKKKKKIKKNGKKDDFLHLGCYNCPSTFSFDALSQSNAIAKTDGMSWSLCARNCQFQSKSFFFS